MSKAEPTISDVMGAVHDLTEAVQTGFAKVETVLDRHEDILKTLVDGQDQLRGSVNILDQRMSKTQNRIEDVVDENHRTLLEHGRRITILEKARV